MCQHYIWTEFIFLDFIFSTIDTFNHYCQNLIINLAGPD